MTREKVKALLWGLLIAEVLASLIVLGSRNLEAFDAALVPCTFATLFAASGHASERGEGERARSVPRKSRPFFP